MCDDGWVATVLVLADRADQHERVSWTSAGDRILSVFIDTFFDGDTPPFGPEYPREIPIVVETAPEFVAAMEDVAAVTGGDYTYGVLLFAARQWRARLDPFPPNQLLWPMFDHAATIPVEAA